MTDHIDRHVLATLQEVMEAEYPVLLDTFLADSEERVRLLRQACSKGGAEELRQAAHSFKGSCSNMGASLLAELCRELEDAARQGLLDVTPGLLEKVEQEFAIVRRGFSAERQRFSELARRNP